MTKFEKMRMAAPSVLRIGLALVFLWFGSQQLVSATQWVRLIPQSILDITHLSAVTLVHFNGSFEIVFGLCLLFGFYTRITSLLLCLHILNIMSVVGYNAIGVRDFGLSIAMISIFLFGVDSFTLDNWLKKRKEQKMVQV